WPVAGASAATTRWAVSAPAADRELDQLSPLPGAQSAYQPLLHNLWRKLAARCCTHNLPYMWRAQWCRNALLHCLRSSSALTPLYISHLRRSRKRTVCLPIPSCVRAKGASLMATRVGGMVSAHGMRYGRNGRGAGAFPAGDQAGRAQCTGHLPPIAARTTFLLRKSERMRWRESAASPS